MEGYYKTPTNQPEPNNLRWSNVIADLMVPQRTLLAGWAMGIPCFYLLETVFRPGRGDPDRGLRGEILLGIWAGGLPLIHTHTFLALGLSSAGVLLYDMIHGGGPGQRKRSGILRKYAVYLAAAAVPAWAEGSGRYAGCWTGTGAAEGERFVIRADGRFVRFAADGTLAGSRIATPF